MVELYNRLSSGGGSLVPGVLFAQQWQAKDCPGPEGAVKLPHIAGFEVLNTWSPRRGRTCRTFTAQDPHGWGLSQELPCYMTFGHRHTLDSHSTPFRRRFYGLCLSKQLSVSRQLSSSCLFVDLHPKSVLHLRRPRSTVMVGLAT